jgi:carbamoyl-phosphate synthase large subunit
MKKVLVTSISGRVGQPVLRTLYNLGLKDVIIYGADANCLDHGQHLCEKMFKLPKGSDSTYNSTLVHLCKQEKIDLVLPTHDTEVFSLSKCIETDDTLDLIISPPATIDICFDKYLTYEFCKIHQIPFAEAYLPSQYNYEFDDVIVKLRKGFAWQGIERNPQNIKSFSDEFMVQKFYNGIEVSCPFYVNREGQLVDFITIVEKYDANNRVCIVTNEYRSILKPFVEKLATVLKIKGVLELECIIDDYGHPHLIELNARFSNTTNVRAAFGFTDVKWVVEEYVFGRSPIKTSITEGTSVRLFQDVIFKK